MVDAKPVKTYTVLNVVIVLILVFTIIGSVLGIIAWNRSDSNTKTSRMYAMSNDSSAGSFKSVDYATTEHVDLSSPGVVDGSVLKIGNRVLVKAQRNPSNNGIYFVSDEGTLERTEDLLIEDQAVDGFLTFVKGGLSNFKKIFVLTVVKKDPNYIVEGPGNMLGQEVAELTGNEFDIFVVFQDYSARKSYTSKFSSSLDPGLDVVFINSTASIQNLTLADGENGHKMIISCDVFYSNVTLIPEHLNINRSINFTGSGQYVELMFDSEVGWRIIRSSGVRIE